MKILSKISAFTATISLIIVATISIANAPPIEQNIETQELVTLASRHIVSQQSINSRTETGYMAKLSSISQNIRIRPEFDR